MAPRFLTFHACPVSQLCIGLFWPSMMALRAAYVPEAMRSTLINMFRMPLNAFVCIVLYEVGCGGCTHAHG